MTISVLFSLLSQLGREKKRPWQQWQRLCLGSATWTLTHQSQSGYSQQEVSNLPTVETNTKLSILARLPRVISQLSESKLIALDYFYAERGNTFTLIEQILFRYRFSFPAHNVYAKNYHPGINNCSTFPWKFLQLLWLQGQAHVFHSMMKDPGFCRTLTSPRLKGKRTNTGFGPPLQNAAHIYGFWLILALPYLNFYLPFSIANLEDFKLQLQIQTALQRLYNRTVPTVAESKPYTNYIHKNIEYRIDHWETQIWTLWVHLHVYFFFNKDSTVL